MKKQNAVIADEIIRQVRVRGPGKTICPSEVARALFPEDWREHMQSVRDAASQLAHSGRIVVLQKGQPIDIQLARGPVRLALPGSEGAGTLDK